MQSIKDGDVKKNLNFENGFIVVCSGFRGGLALLWKQGLDLDIQSYTNWHISANTKIEDIQCQVTGFYGHPDTSKREGR